MIQVLSLAFVSSLLGTALGVVAQFALPRALKDFLPVTAVLSLAPAGIAAGWAIGLGTTLLFALIPLLPLRNISPLSALRATFDADRPARDWLAWILFALIAGGIWAFAVAITANIISGSWFAGALLAFGLYSALMPRRPRTHQLSLIAFTIPTESGGYEQITTMSGFVAWMARTIGEKSVVDGGYRLS